MIPSGITTEKNNFTGGDINRAGQRLIEKNLSKEAPDVFTCSMEALSYWRTCHLEPLEVATRLLKDSALTLDRGVVIARRLKRADSIIQKLRRFPKMQLKNMQDIGGCRSILKNRKRVDKLVRLLKRNRHIKVRHDYITQPKSSGYRSVHLVGRFPGEFGKQFQIEIQVRTALQHSWATAVEIVDLFEDKEIKADQGPASWSRFFFRAGEIFAYFENIPLFADMGISEKRDLIYNRLGEAYNEGNNKELLHSASRLYSHMIDLGVLQKLEGYANSLKIVDDQIAKSDISGYALIQLDLQKCQVKSSFFSERKLAMKYLEAEKRAASVDDLVVALISTEAVGGLKEAFPNFFADSTVFAEHLIAFQDAYKKLNPSRILRALDRWFG